MRPPRFWIREALLCALVFVLLAYSWMFSKVSVPNERSRAYLTMAIVDEGVIAVDGPVGRFGRVFDLARYGRHYFTDKAPGASLLAVPVYALWRLSQPSAASDIVDVINLARTWVMLPIGLLGFVLLRSLLRALRLSESAVDVSSLGFSLGSSMLHYAGAFYGHAIVAVLALGTLRGLVAAGLCGPESALSLRGRRAALIAAGACAGLAGLTEYQAVPLAVLLGLPLLFVPSRVRDLAWYALGGLPFAVGLLAYNRQAFGGAFALSYEHLLVPSLQELHGSGLAGATHPQLDAFVGLLFSQHRGLFVTAPLLGFGLAALIARPRALPLALWVTLCATAGYFLLIVASSSVWYGGWSFGPRLLVPIMGLLAVPAAFALNAAPLQPALQILGRSAAIVGVLYQHAVHAVLPELPPEFTRPLPDAVLPLWQARVVAPNLACKWLGLGPIDLLPLAVLIACVVVIVACRGLAGRPVLSVASLLGGCGLLLLLLAAPPGIERKEQEGLLRRARAWQAEELRCQG